MVETSESCPGVSKVGEILIKGSRRSLFLIQNINPAGHSLGTGTEEDVYQTVHVDTRRGAQRGGCFLYSRFTYGRESHSQADCNLHTQSNLNTAEIPSLPRNPETVNKKVYYK